MLPDLQKGVLYTHPILQLCKSITQCVVKQLSSNLVTMLSNVVQFIPQNFEAIAVLQAELCLVKVEKLDACIKPFCKSDHIYYE